MRVPSYDADLGVLPISGLQELVDHFLSRHLKEMVKAILYIG